ncbi:MAG: dihydropteroate synthase [Acidipila sp.]|nr:dihydropteroate synthase [Acidipila sp.]
MPPCRRFRLRLPSRTLVLGERTLVMGVINVTPDSFSDGGQYFDADSATDRALAMEREGADLIDIGGESTRPGSRGVSMQEEIRRVLPLIVRLRRKLKVPISIDTQKSAVAEAAVGAGAEIINDVSALRTDPELAGVARRHGVPLVLMHMRGRPRTMQKLPFARNVLADVTRGLRDALARARKAGLPKSQLILDPGIGFGKSYQQNCELLARLRELAQLGCPLLVGASRKSFIGKLLGDAPADRRKWGTAAAVTASILGGAHIVRVHDVAEMVQVARIADCILQEL